MAVRDRYNLHNKGSDRRTEYTLTPLAFHCVRQRQPLRQRQPFHFISVSQSKIRITLDIDHHSR